MTIFWTLAAGLAFLAVLFVIAPLIRPDQDDPDVDQDEINLALFKQQLAELDADLAAGKLDQAQYDSARHDLERGVLYDVRSGGDAAAKAGVVLPGPRTTMLALLIAVPASALALYLLLGEQQIIPHLAAGTQTQQAPAGHAGAEGMPPLEDLIARLEQRLEEVPDDAEGWMMLGRTYFATDEPGKAEEALARAYELTPEDVTIVLAYAESVAANQGNDLNGRPAELISEALAVDPSNPTALWLSGMAAYQRGQYTAAAVAWKNAREQVDPNSDDANELAQLIAQAERQAGVPPQVQQVARTSDTGEGTAMSANGTDAAPDQAPAAADSGAGLTVQVSIDPALADRMPPVTTVFIYAKAAAGPPMPLAVQRVTVGDLPLAVTLDDSMAMMPSMSLSSFPEVIVGARVSPSGQAMPRPGDLQGETGPVQNDAAEPIEVRIDSVLP